MKDKPSKSIREAFRALKIAVAKALADHKLTGDPIFVWENGRVVRISAKNIRVTRPK